MPLHSSVTMFALALSIVTAASGVEAGEPRYADAIARHAAPLVEGRVVPGMAIAIYKDGEVEHHGLGVLDDKDPRRPDERTLFEIGSVTKVFTAAALVDAQRRGELAIDDPLSKHLPEGVRSPSKDDVVPTLAQLADHSSGLARLPSNIEATSLDDPYAAYTAERLWAYIGSCELERVPGESASYSNLAVGLLGTIVAQKAGMPYEQLVRERITGPLGMQDTAITRTDEQKARSAPPHSAGGAPSTNWNFDALAGAGALWSTTADLMKFARAQLEPSGTPLDEVFPRMHTPRVAMAGTPAKVGLGWFVAGDGSTLVHDGGTNGYCSSVLVNPQSKIAVVVLANAAEDSVGAVAERIFQTVSGMTVDPVAVAASVKVDEAALDRLTGTYRHPALGAYTVTRDGDRLMAQLAGQPAFEVFPTSPTEFFYRVVEARLRFDVPADTGAATSVTLFQNGAELKFERGE